MVKSKAKADRAAARQAAQAPLIAAMLLPIPASVPADAPSPDAGASESQPQQVDATEETNPAGPKEVAPDRTEILRSKTLVVGRFMQLMVPILIDVYAASVITPVRVKTLTGLLKAVSFLDADGLKRVLTVRSMFFLSFDHPSIHPTVCTCGKFCLIDPLLERSPIACDRCSPAG